MTEKFKILSYPKTNIGSGMILSENPDKDLRVKR